MKQNKKYDERQLLNRGKAFQYGFLAAMIAMVSTYFVVSVIELKISAYAALLICLWIPLTACLIALIVKDAYDDINGDTGRLLLTLFGIAGLFILGTTLVRIAIGNESFLRNGELTDTVGHIFTGSCMVAISIVYWIKQNLNKKKFADD